ncbi:hypothetical protein MASR2M36_32430 [Providencia sp.]
MGLSVSKTLRLFYFYLTCLIRLNNQHINDGLKLISEYSARTLNLQDYGIGEGKRASLLILPAENGFDAVRRQVPVRYCVRDGRVIANTQPAVTQIHLTEPETIRYGYSPRN